MHKTESRSRNMTVAIEIVCVRTLEAGNIAQDGKGKWVTKEESGLQHPLNRFIGVFFFLKNTQVNILHPLRTSSNASVP